jgi:hypothetical protein
MLDNRHNLRFTTPARAKSRAWIAVLFEAASKPLRVLSERLFSCLFAYGDRRREPSGSPLPQRYCNLRPVATRLQSGDDLNRLEANTMTTTSTTRPARASKRAKQPQSAAIDLPGLGRVTFDSVLTDEQVMQYEDDYEKSWGPNRRIANIILARSREQLIDGFKTSGGVETLLDIIERASAWEKHCRASAEIAACAVARLIAVTAACIEGIPAQEETA